MSAEIKKKLEDEIQALEKELREELPKALKTAAALGDLSENADYSAARERGHAAAAALTGAGDRQQKRPPRRSSFLGSGYRADQPPYIESDLPAAFGSIRCSCST